MYGIAAISPYDSTQNPPLGKIGSVPMCTVWDPEFHTEATPLKEFPVIKQNKNGDIFKPTYLCTSIHVNIVVVSGRLALDVHVILTDTKKRKCGLLDTFSDAN